MPNEHRIDLQTSPVCCGSSLTSIHEEVREEIEPEGKGAAEATGALKALSLKNDETQSFKVTFYKIEEDGILNGLGHKGVALERELAECRKITNSDISISNAFFPIQTHIERPLPPHVENLATQVTSGLSKEERASILDEMNFSIFFPGYITSIIEAKASNFASLPDSLFVDALTATEENFREGEKEKRFSHPAIVRCREAVHHKLGLDRFFTSQSRWTSSVTEVKYVILSKDRKNKSIHSRFLAFSAPLTALNSHSAIQNFRRKVLTSFPKRQQVVEKFKDFCDDDVYIFLCTSILFAPIAMFKNCFVEFLNEAFKLDEGSIEQMVNKGFFKFVDTPGKEQDALELIPRPVVAS